MKVTARRERLREILSGDQCVFPASVHDPLSGRVAQDLGFEVAMFAGSIASLAVLAAPDLVLLTLTEFAEQARRITRAIDLPVIVDADHGYGNALNVMRTVEELETAGVAALTIEDTELPIAFGSSETRLVTVDEAAGKMRAAISARSDRELIIIGRTSAPAVTGIDDAIERCLSFQAAGVDAVFLSGIRSRSDLEKLCEMVRVPVLLGALPAELQDVQYLGNIGVRIALQGHLPIRAALYAIHKTMKALRDGVSPAQIDGLLSQAGTDHLARAADYRRWTEQYLNG
ncbi:isocitrate lyase/PEP mutase family protein [Microvirga sp. P5_D2]